MLILVCMIQWWVCSSSMIGGGRWDGNGDTGVE